MRHPNQYSQSDFRPLYWMIGISLLGFILKTAYDPIELHRPLIGQVEAKQPVQVIVTPPKPMTIEEKIRAKFPEDPDYAVKIAKCESSMNPKAINTKNRNGSVDYGLFQINSVHGYTANYLLDADNNLRIARELFDRQGWRPWVCSWK